MTPALTLAQNTSVPLSWLRRDWTIQCVKYQKLYPMLEVAP